MAVQNKPIYVFDSIYEYGIDQVPINRLVLVENTRKLYILIDNSGLSSMNTVQDAINAGKLKLFWSEISDGPNSGLTATSATYWGGYRIINVSENEPTSADGVENDVWFQYLD
jgi:hypothetical protein